MRIFFLLLVLANISYFAWQMYTTPPTTANTHTPLLIGNHTPPLVLLKEMPSQPQQTQPLGPQSQREPVLQELPTAEAEPTLAPSP